jgi:5-methylcytosine-specific restriction endonuclease McrA
MKAGFMVIASDIEGGDMDISLPILIVGIIVILIIGYVLTQLLREDDDTDERSPRKRRIVRSIRKKVDHGGRIAKEIGHERSPEWARVAREHRLREPACVACGYKGKKVQVHHIKPFHLHPHLELDPDNLITLCSARGKEHHLLLGHLDSWKSYNEHIREDAKRFYRKSAAQIRADIRWQKKMAARP